MLEKMIIMAIAQAMLPQMEAETEAQLAKCGIITQVRIDIKDVDISKIMQFGEAQKESCNEYSLDLGSVILKAFRNDNDNNKE